MPIRPGDDGSSRQRLGHGSLTELDELLTPGLTLFLGGVAIYVRVN